MTENLFDWKTFYHMIVFSVSFPTAANPEVAMLAP